MAAQRSEAVVKFDRQASSWICCALVVLLAAVDTACAAEPPPKVDPAAKNSFGIKPEWVKSPAMLEAMERLHAAGVIADRRGSLTFFRWTNGTSPQLAHIGLWGAGITDDSIAATEQLPDLEYVSLYETNVDDAGLKPLAKLPKLRRLTVAPICRYEKPGFGAPQWSYPFVAERTDRPRITAAGLRTFASTTTLEELEILDAQLTSAHLGLLATWPKLSSVALPCTIDDAAVKYLSACRRLNRLTLGYREVTAAEIEALAAWPKLRRLTLIHARLADDALTALGKLSSVEELKLEDCGLTTERVAHLRLAPKTKSLLLERNEIGAAGLAHLAILEPNVLGLEFNDIDDVGLAHLPQLKSVVDLRLAYCRGITDAGIRNGSLQRMPQLKRLELRGLKQVTDAAVDDLAKLTDLAHIGLRETSIEPAGIARLKTALPQTEVFK